MVGETKKKGKEKRDLSVGVLLGVQLSMPKLTSQLPHLGSMMELENHSCITLCAAFDGFAI